MKVSGQLHAPAALLPGKEPPIPMGEEAVWAPEPILMLLRRKNLALTGNRTPIVQHVVPVHTN
jgi:hypothetical protein